MIPLAIKEENGSRYGNFLKANGKVYDSF